MHLQPANADVAAEWKDFDGLANLEFSTEQRAGYYGAKAGFGEGSVDP